MRGYCYVVKGLKISVLGDFFWYLNQNRVGVNSALGETVLGEESL